MIKENKFFLSFVFIIFGAMFINIALSSLFNAFLFVDLVLFADLVLLWGILTLVLMGENK